MKKIMSTFVLFLFLSSSVFASVIPAYGFDGGWYDSFDRGWYDSFDMWGGEPIDTSDESIFDFGPLPEDGENDGSGRCTAGCAEPEPAEIDSSQEVDPPADDEVDDGWYPPSDAPPEDNKIKVTGTTQQQKAAEVVKEISSRNNEKVAEATGANKPLMQRIIEGVKGFISDLNILKVFNQSFAQTIRQVINLGITAAGFLLPIPPGVGTLLSLMVNQAFAFHEAYPSGLPSTPVVQLSLDAAIAIANEFGGVAHEGIDVNDAGESQTNVIQIAIPDGAPTTKTMVIDGKTFVVSISGDGTQISVSSPPSSTGTTGVQPLQVGWDYGSFNSYYTGSCGDGVLYPTTEQCEVDGTHSILDNSYCPQPTLCEGRLTAVRPPYGSCIIPTCQCLYDTPTLGQWQYLPGSCGATCNATVGCSGGQVCSNGICGTAPLCGNGIIDVSQGEECDVGVLSCPAGTTCSSCQCIPTIPDCRNGLLETGETCDVGILPFLEVQQGSNVGICRKSCEECQCVAGVSSRLTTQQGVGPTQVGGIPIEICQTKNALGIYEPARDENCDGRIDEGCVCTPGDSRICGERGSTCGAGGIQTCQASGEWGVCTVDYVPQDEVCDGIDNDCDFEVDECGCIGFNASYFNEATWGIGAIGSTVPTTQTGINTTVYAVIDTNFSTLVPLNITLYETDCPGNALTISCSQEVGRYNTTTNSAGTAYIPLNITDSLLFQTRVGDGINRTFYYVAYGYTQNITSTSLFVAPGVSAGPGESGLLYGNITGVYHGQVYLNTTAVLFNHTFSRAGGLRTNWSIVEDGFTSTRDSFWHNFTTAGQKTILLQVSNGNGGFGAVQIGVLVISNTSTGELMTFIDYPRYNHVVKTGRNESTTVVFQANTSFALKESATTCGPLLCLGGACPSRTNNTDSACGGTTRSIDSGPGMIALVFGWEVMQDTNFIAVGSPVAGRYTKAITFGSGGYSDALNDKQVRVTTNFTGGGLSLQSSFVRRFTLGKCIAQGQQFVVTDINGIVRYVRSTVEGITTNSAPFSPTVCRGEDEQIGTADDCVPAGYICGPEGGYRVVVNATTPTGLCEDYLDAASCAAARPYSSSSVQCFGTRPSVSCVWEGICKTKYTITNFEGQINTCIEGISSQGQCTEGLRDVTIDADFSLDGSPLICRAFQDACVDRADTLVCGRPAFELPFFGFWQMILGLVGIVLLGILRRKS
jgi:hypothetical protein